MSDKYKKLMGNTLIFAIGSFSSKLLVLLMMHYYTSVLMPEQYSVADRITTTANLLMPIVMLSINEATIRFAMDKSLRKSDVFTSALKTVLMGFAVFLILSPLMLLFKMLSPYIVLIAVFVLFGMLKSVTAQFVRGIGLVKLFVIDGFIATATTILFNILFLSVFKWGTSGYVLATVASNIVSVVGLFAVARLWRFVKPGRKCRSLHREMLKYSIPLIPTTMFWWITTVSDRYFVAGLCGEAANGLYSVACKLPNLLTIVSAIFYQAWQISAVSEKDEEGATAFYSEIYDYYLTMLLLAASGLLMLLRPITATLYAASYGESWKFAPFLIIGEVFSSLVTFLGTFYMVEKKNATVPLAVAFGAVLNIALNALLIPKFGPVTAAFTTFVSYIAAFCVRAVDVRRIVKLNFRSVRLGFTLVLLMMQAMLMYNAKTSSLFIQIAAFAVIFIFNIKPFIRLISALLERFIPRRRRRNA